MSLPAAFIERMYRLMEKEEADAFFRTYRKARALGLRINPLKIAPEFLRNKTSFHLMPVPFCPGGFYYEAEDEPGKHPFHQAGLYYIQEPSAMFVGEVVDASPGERVLDLCAAPGGKSTQIGAAMKNKGFLLANDISPKRAKALSENIERMGITNALVTNETPERLARYFPGYFDKILVDAPCSGEGMFRKDPEAAQYWSSNHVDECAALQAGILDQAYRMLRTGGTLIYSTCTFSPEEDERTIGRLLAAYPDLELLPISKNNGVEDGRPEWTEAGGPAIRQTARLWPHRLRGEGHFLAKLQKHGASSSRNLKMAKPAKEARLNDYRRFEKACLSKKLTGTFYFLGNQLFLLPDGCPDFSKLKVVRPGLHLGEQKKNRFEPNHALALALEPEDFRLRFPMQSDGEEWQTYLRGETLPAPDAEKGWTVVTIDGYPLGWGKAAGGMLKNFYPKGLRRRSMNQN
ncbi:NOL1/NOP2/sun family putative RNA methylase [Sporolactobacillus sp. THM7-7]|nr:NOL1/NOP2/sun family putative RNA methylase [Sporolactobacillus sp. THM7-7]